MITYFSIKQYLYSLKDRKGFYYLDNKVVDFIINKEYSYILSVYSNAYPYKKETDYFRNFNDIFFKNDDLYLLSSSFSVFSDDFEDLYIKELPEEEAMYLELLKG